VELQSAEIAPLDNSDIEIVEGGETYSDSIDGIISKAFKGYSNHYFSNPVLKKELITEGYKEWARTCLTSGNPGDRCWVALAAGRPVGFMACTASGGKAQITLNGIDADSRGRRIYGNIVRKALSHYKAEGCESFSGFTQAHNLAAQRAWVREGFSLRGAFVTVHINSLLSHTRRKKLEFEATGDDACANLHAASEKALREVYSGSTPKILGCRMELLLPPAAGEKLEAAMSFPYEDADAGEAFVTVKAYTAAGALSVVQYLNLKF